ncbi:transposable element Tcb2 transposase [Trichonephila clavipes]|nr:transposable element Tcb2 transposase [Trichonephila clavipes]
MRFFIVRCNRNVNDIRKTGAIEISDYLILEPLKGHPRQISGREERHIGRNARVKPTASSAASQAEIETSLGAPVSSRTIRKRLAEGHLRSHPLRVLPLMPTHRHLRLEWCHAGGTSTAAERNQVVFNDESRFNLSSDDNRVCVWRSRGERLNLAIALQRHTTPTAGVMVWVSLPTIHGHP